jgi:hypothetical protein
MAIKKILIAVVIGFIILYAAIYITTPKQKRIYIPQHIGIIMEK